MIRALLFVLLLTGCAAPAVRDPEVCFVKVMGTTEDGSMVVATLCMTPKAFEESQK